MLSWYLGMAMLACMKPRVEDLRHAHHPHHCFREYAHPTRCR